MRSNSCCPTRSRIRKRSRVSHAKPAPRWTILVGKYVGVVLFVALHATLFVGGTWLGMGVATDTWDLRYWVAVPLLVTRIAKSVGEPALALVESTWLGVETATV